jgi:hypothetical protein
MRYYCNICKKDITKAEFLYSIDKFDRPLCREHQQLERKLQEPTLTPKEPEIDLHSEPVEETVAEETKSKFGSLLKKAVIATGKGIVKGAKKIANSTRKTMQIRQWKDDILRRMSMSQLKRLCFEKRISTKKSVLKESRSGGLYWKEYNCSKADLVGRLKNKATLDDIIFFAKRNHINIRDILRDIDQKKADWKVKEITETMKEAGVSLFLEVEKAVREFRPLRKYDKEIFYQDSLASWLRSKFPDTDIEVSRGSTRPDIVVEGIAIEVKGPTFEKDLQTISDKCMRYRQYFPQGLICVLFSVYVNQHRYNDWEQGMEKTFPDVKIIKI